jgi:hypothetical protein
MHWYFIMPTSVGWYYLTMSRLSTFTDGSQQKLRVYISHNNDTFIVNVLYEYSPADTPRKQHDTPRPTVNNFS